MNLETATTGLVNDEANGLTLLDIVEADNTDVAVGVLRTTLAHFVEYLLRRVAVKQRQLPESPVVICRGRIFFKLNCRDKTLVKHVIDLLVDLLITQRGKVGKGFVTALFR
jgi:hypothetical protein